MLKADLRKLFLEKRASLSASAVSEMSDQIAEKFFENIDLRDTRKLHTFIPIRKFNEVDTSMIYERVWLDFPEILTVTPRTDLSTGQVESVRFARDTKFIENRWGICEPVEGVVIDAQLIDVVIVPLLCFDERGHRVGYGKGIYDRFLATCRPDCLKVGVSCFPPVDLIDDTDVTDIGLDICLTPDTVYRTKKGHGPDGPHPLTKRYLKT